MRIGFAFVSAMIAVVLVAALAGCGGGGGGSPLPDPIVRFINSSPDSNPLDYSINADQKATGIAYLDNSGEITIENGDRDVIVADSVTTNILDTIAVSFERDKKYIEMTVGLENFGVENEKRLRLLNFFFDKNPPNGTRARLLIIHAYMREAGFQTPNIDFQGGVVGSYDSNNPLFHISDLPFGSLPAELEVDAEQPLIFEARRAGTENVITSDPSTTFDAGGIYLALVTGLEGGPGAQAPQVKYIKIN